MTIYSLFVKSYESCQWQGGYAIVHSTQFKASEEVFLFMPSLGKKQTVKSSHPSFVANPQQAAAIAHMDGPAAFIAAAGTGKTAILVQRLVRLVADEGITPEAILCVTFTRAAAHEMEKRALKALKERTIAAKDVKALRVVTFH